MYLALDARLIKVTNPQVLPSSTSTIPISRSNETFNKTSDGQSETLVAMSYPASPDQVDLMELPRLQLHTLGAKEHLPRGYIEDTLRFFKQFTQTVSRGYMLSSFTMYPPL